MVGMGLLMLLVVIVGWVMHFKGRLYESPLFLRLAHWSMPVGFMAVLAGWTVTEVGRQPWVVYGLLRTSHAVSPSLTTFDVALVVRLLHRRLHRDLRRWFMLLRRIVRAGPGGGRGRSRAGRTFAGRAGATGATAVGGDRSRRFGRGEQGGHAT